MRSHRKIILIITILTAGGSVGYKSWYGHHLQSESFRREMESELSAFFELPCELGGIRGRTFASRVFENVVIYLPDRRDKVLSCPCG